MLSFDKTMTLYPLDSRISLVTKSYSLSLRKSNRHWHPCMENALGKNCEIS